MHGFEQNQVTLQEAFKFEPHRFNIPDGKFRHVCMQDGKIWAMVDGRNFVARHDLRAEDHRQPKQIDGHFLNPQSVRKMVVDREGIHCLFLYDYDVYFATWNDDRSKSQIHSINELLQEEAGHDGRQSFLTGNRPRAIRAIDIYHEPGDHEMFELVFATQDGSIFHSALAYDADTGKLEILEKFDCMLELPDSRAILDLKIVRIQESFMVLAVTDNCLYQFCGEGMLRSVLQSYKPGGEYRDASLINKHMLMIEASVQGLDSSRQVTE